MWLLKTEPSCYSFDNLWRDKATVWDGVTNHLALKNLRQIKKNDRLLIYHTGNEKAVVGIAAALEDATAVKGNDKLASVRITALKKLPQPVPLATLKADPRFAGWELLRLPRLSVVPVTDAQWAAALELGAIK